MLTLINANQMLPPIAPIGLDYVAGTARAAGLEVEVLDLGVAEDPAASLAAYFRAKNPELVGISFRNVDDCFWPGRSWFLPELISLVDSIRRQSEAPIVLGGVGFSIFAQPILERARADFGVRGDGELAMAALARELRAGRRFDRVPGLLWRENGGLRCNPPAWPPRYSISTARDAIDNATYFRRGGQVGIETRRGCDRACLYCADPLAKGNLSRLRPPAEIADEAESLLAQGVDVLHLCDSEFNIPPKHAHEVCEEFIRRGLGERIRWYAYLAVVPFDAGLARRMRRAGCAGINFTGDSASTAMLRVYRQPHCAEDLAQAVRLCRKEGIAVMIDLLFGGPGETPESVAESVRHVQQIDPDCAGAALGIRLYPGTAIIQTLAAQGDLEANPAIHRCYDGPIDLVRPNFYVSPALGKRPARVVRELIAGDPRFFEPADDSPEIAEPVGANYNYNENRPLVDAIAAGARGAYWDILRKMRPG